MNAYRSVFSSQPDQFLGLGNKKKRQYKDQLKGTYGDNWRDVWQKMKTQFGGSNLRGLLRQDVALNTTTLSGQSQISLPGVSAPATSGQLSTTGGEGENGTIGSGAIIALVALVVIGLGIFIYRKMHK